MNNVPFPRNRARPSCFLAVEYRIDNLLLNVRAVYPRLTAHAGERLHAIARDGQSLDFRHMPTKGHHMKVMFVCTGNICRSPMGELMFPHFFSDPDLQVDSAGTQGLINHEIDPSSGKLMERDGIDASRFRSKRLTPQLARESDLIICFTKHQQRQIVSIAPTVSRRTITLSDLAALCEYCAQHGLLEGNTYEERLESALDQASLVRPQVGETVDIADPYRKEFEAFEVAHEQIGQAIATIAASVLPRTGRHSR